MHDIIPENIKIETPKESYIKQDVPFIHVTGKTDCSVTELLEEKDNFIYRIPSFDSINNITVTAPIGSIVQIDVNGMIIFEELQNQSSQSYNCCLYPRTACYSDIRMVIKPSSNDTQIYISYDIIILDTPSLLWMKTNVFNTSLGNDFIQYCSGFISKRYI